MIPRRVIPSFGLEISRLCRVWPRAAENGFLSPFILGEMRLGQGARRHLFTWESA